MSNERESHPEGFFFVLLAWVSPLIPIAVGISFVLINPNPRAETTNWLAGLFALVCFVGLMAAVVSFFGVRRNRVLLIVPAAVFGLILNLVVGSLSCLLIGLSGWQM
jgi:hypothetical protein